MGTMGHTTRTFTYTPLPTTGRHIRLLTVHPGHHRDAIHITLREVDLDTNPLFDCLSYTWQKASLRYWTLNRSKPLYRRKADAARSIICNGQQLHINENLHDFLARLRQWPLARPFWVDAICINQADTAERSAQVNMMERIYRSADSVVVWLGESNRRAEAGMRFMQALYESRATDNNHNVDLPSFHARDYVLKAFNGIAVDEQLLGPGKPLVAAGFYQGKYAVMTDIIEREYFRRMWVVQEMVLAKKLLFYVGSTEITLEALQHAINLHSRVTASGIGSGMGAMRYFSSTAVSSMPFIFQAREQLHRAEGVSWCLEDYIQLCQDQVATEPVDKVFALLGMADKASLVHVARADNHDHDSEQVRLHAEYTKDVVQVYLECTKVLLSRTSLSNVLSLVGKVEAGVKNLPSWVPDYSVPLRPKPFASFGPKRFGAASSVTASYSISRDGKHLGLSAAPFDTIAKVGESSNSISLYNRLKVHGAMLDLVADCGSTYVPTGETTLMAFCRAMTADLFGDSTCEIVPEVVQTGFLSWICVTFGMALAAHDSVTFRWFSHIIRRIMGTMNTIPEEKELQPSEFSIINALDRFVEVVAPELFAQGSMADGATGKVAMAIEAVYLDRRIFRTEGGYLGIGPSKLDKGDQVILIAGSDMPFIFRRNGEAMSLIGSAYVHGIMNGEALTQESLDFGPFSIN